MKIVRERSVEGKGGVYSLQGIRRDTSFVQARTEYKVFARLTDTTHVFSPRNIILIGMSVE